MRRICAMFLTVVLTMGLMPTMSFAQEDESVNVAVIEQLATNTVDDEETLDSEAGLIDGTSADEAPEGAVIQGSEESLDESSADQDATVMVMADQSFGSADEEHSSTVVASYPETIPASELTTFSAGHSQVSPAASKYLISKNILGGEYGSVTIIGNNATLYPEGGTTVRFRTSPKTGYTLTKMSYTNDVTGKTIALTRVSGTGKAGTNSEYEFTMPYGNVTLNATFGVNNKAISKNVTGSGSVFIVDNPDGSIGSLYPQVGQAVTFKAPAEKGNRLTRMSYTLSSTGMSIALKKVAGTTSTYTFTMPNENVTLNATFEPTEKKSTNFFNMCT